MQNTLNFILVLLLIIGLICMIHKKDMTSTSSDSTPEMYVPTQQMYSLGSTYPPLIYNSAPLLPPGAEFGLNYLPPAQGVANNYGGYPVVQVDGTYGSPDPVYIAGPVPQINPYA
jgi:hypothetical protein